MALTLSFHDYEQPEFRGDTIVRRFTQEQTRVYHIAYGDMMSNVPRWGESATLNDVAWETQAGIMLPRVKGVPKIQKHPEGAFHVVTVTWYQIRRYSGTATTSPQELMGSREGVDSGWYRRWDRYFASTDGSCGITEGDAYTGEALTDETT